MLARTSARQATAHGEAAHPAPTFEHVHWHDGLVRHLGAPHYQQHLRNDVLHVGLEPYRQLLRLSRLAHALLRAQPCADVVRVGVERRDQPHRPLAPPASRPEHCLHRPLVHRFAALLPPPPLLIERVALPKPPRDGLAQHGPLQVVRIWRCLIERSGHRAACREHAPTRRSVRRALSCKRAVVGSREAGIALLSPLLPRPVAFVWLPIPFAAADAARSTPPPPRACRPAKIGLKLQA
eukprot:360469-Chlamydomonas_euryale.AAC.2